MNLLRSVFLVGVAMLPACKEVKTTNAPGSQPMGAESGDSQAANPQVVGVTEVPLDQIPQLTVTLDIGKCIGRGRWYDSAAGGGLIAGAISVSPTREPKGDMEQPTPWVFDPSIEKAGDLVATKSSQKWRLDRASYTVAVVAYEVETPAKKTTFSIPAFNFTSSNDVNYEVVGDWDASNSTCRLSRKTP